MSDTGIGIPPDEAARLFGPFVRGSNARIAGLPGTGLGLVIVKVLVEMHGGHVKVESVLERGDHVQRVPARARQTAAAPMTDRVLADRGRPGHRARHQDRARQERVRGDRRPPTARDGLRAFHSQHPDIVVLDVGLPEMDGWTVLERIREMSEVPVLMLTAHGQEADKVRGLRAGADDYLTKPFGNAEFVARVQALLRRSAGGRARTRPRSTTTAASG